MVLLMDSRQSATVVSSGTSWPRLEYSTKILPSSLSGPEAAEDIAAGAMKEVRDGAEDFALRAFARAGRAEQKNAAVLHAPLDLS